MGGEAISWDRHDADDQRRYVLVRLLEAAAVEYRRASHCERQGMTLSAGKAETVAAELFGIARAVADMTLRHLPMLDGVHPELSAGLRVAADHLAMLIEVDSAGHLWHAVEQWGRVRAVLTALPGPFLRSEVTV